MKTTSCKLIQNVNFSNMVPTAGFEPATYRLRSDCSAVEPSRRVNNIVSSSSINKSQQIFQSENYAKPQ